MKIDNLNKGDFIAMDKIGSGFRFVELINEIFFMIFYELRKI